MKAFSTGILSQIKIIRSELSHNTGCVTTTIDICYEHILHTKPVFKREIIERCYTPGGKMEEIKKVIEMDEETKRKLFKTLIDKEN